MKKDNIPEDTKKQSKLYKFLKVMIWIMAVFVVILLGARLYFRLLVSSYYDNSEKTFEIPDINSGFIAQGLAFDDRSGYFFTTGYMNDGSSSPIYIVDKSTDEYLKRLIMQNPDGTEFYGHAGGITVHGDYIYVAGSADHCLYVFSYDEAINAEDNHSLKSLGTFPMPDDMSVAFTYSDSDVIYAGEFYRDPNYSTGESHKMTTSAGDYNQALMFAYRFSDEPDALFGIERAPFECYSITDLVQGMCTHDGKIFLSTSYGLAFSHIYEYDKPVSSKNVTYGGTELPLFELDSSCLTKDYKFPPMAEEIVIVDNRLYTMCESASNKYIFGKITSSKWCYSTDLEWDD